MQKSVPGLLILSFCWLLAGCTGQSPQMLSTAMPSAGFARTALADGAPQVALNVSTHLLAANPGDEAALLVQGDALASLGRTAEAEAVFRRVIARDPGSPAACRGLGRILLATDPAAAQGLFQRALAGAPRDAAALNDLGIAFDLQGQQTEAQAAYRRALAVSPDMVAATANLALSLSLGGDPAQGLKMLRPLAASADAPPRLRYDLAAVATMAGDRQEAADVLKNDMPSDKLQAALDGFAALSPPP